MGHLNKILVLFAHPALHKSRINNKILKSLHGIEGLTVNNLYERYPDFHIDVKREQKLLLEHDIIVWQHPFYWYSAPAIVKEWMDLVLEHGFAYGSMGKALLGKKIFNSISTGGTVHAYAESGFTIHQFLTPYIQTARLCQMKYLPPYVIHGTHLLDTQQIDIEVERYKNILNLLLDTDYSDQELASLNYLNDLINLKSI